MRHTVLTSLLTAAVVTFALGAGAAPISPVMTELSSVAIAAEQNIVRIDINNTDATTLQRELSGIGKTKAEAIVSYREEHGDFASVDELLEIKGIGKALLERNRNKLVVN